MKQLKFENLVPEEKAIPEIIPIRADGLQPRKIEELLPNDNIMLDTYLIYSTGGYHPFYGVPNTLPRYQQKIWPYVKRIKFAGYFSKEKLDLMRKRNLRENYNTSQINPYINHNYMYVNILTTGISPSFDTRRKKIYNRIRNKKCLLHRLVALAWVLNPENKPQVMHINDDTTNYLIENLKWGTISDNTRGRKQRSPDTMEQKYLNFVDKGMIKG